MFLHDINMEHKAGKDSTTLFKLSLYFQLVAVSVHEYKR